MDGLQIALGLGALTVSVIAFCWYKFSYSPYQLFKRLSIPTPPVQSFVGNALVFRDMVLLDVYEMWIKEFGKVFGYYIGAKPAMVVSDLDIIKEVLVKQFDNFTERSMTKLNIMVQTRSGLPRGLVFMQENEWRRIRPIVSPSFSSKKLNLMIPIIERNCHSLNKKLHEVCTKHSVVDVLKIYGDFTMQTILATAFGSEVNILEGEANDLTRVASKMFGGGGSNSGMYLWTKIISTQIPLSTLFFGKFTKFMVQVLRSLRDVSMQLIEERCRKSDAEEKKMDFVQLLLDAKSEDNEGKVVSGRKLTNEEVMVLCTDFLLGGYETSRNVLAYTCYLLALNPDVQEKLHQAVEEYYQENKDASLYNASHSIQYLEWVIQESLRIYPPIPRTRRMCKKTCTINGVTIPAGCDVEVSIQHIQRSPDYWDRPELFRPERFSPEEKEGRHPMCYMPFGSGPRYCIGMRFGQMESKMSLLSVIRKFKFERASETQVPLKTVTGMTQTPRSGVFLRVIPRV